MYTASVVLTGSLWNMCAWWHDDIHLHKATHTHLLANNSTTIISLQYTSLLMSQTWQ